MSSTQGPIVYLAGPIDGLMYKAAVDWRKDVTLKLKENGIECLSPMRHKEFLAGVQVLGGSGQHPLTTQKGIFSRDYFDVRRAGVIFVNLLGATKVSIGTTFEIAWAYNMQKPVVLVIEDDGNPHDHMFIREASPYKVNSIEDGLSVVAAILLP